MPYGFHSFIPENEQLEDDSENKLTCFFFLFFFGSLCGSPFFGVKKRPGGGLKHFLVIHQAWNIFFFQMDWFAIT